MHPWQRRGSLLLGATPRGKSQTLWILGALNSLSYREGWGTFGDSVLTPLPLGRRERGEGVNGA